jgi:hypothetical protein
MKVNNRMKSKGRREWWKKGKTKHKWRGKSDAERRGEGKTAGREMAGRKIRVQHLLMDPDYSTLVSLGNFF